MNWKTSKSIPDENSKVTFSYHVKSFKYIGHGVYKNNNFHFEQDPDSWEKPITLEPEKVDYWVYDRELLGTLPGRKEAK